MIGKSSIKYHYIKKEFDSHLNIEDITYAYYTHAKRVRKDFEIKDLINTMICMLSDTLLLADVFESFWKICLEIYELDCPCFLPALGISMARRLKKD